MRAVERIVDQCQSMRSLRELCELSDVSDQSDKVLIHIQFTSTLAML